MEDCAALFSLLLSYLSLKYYDNDLLTGVFDGQKINIRGDSIAPILLQNSSGKAAIQMIKEIY